MSESKASASQDVDNFYNFADMRMGMWDLTQKCSCMVWLSTWMSLSLNTAVVSENFCHLVLYFSYIPFIKLLMVLIPRYLNWSKQRTSLCALCSRLTLQLQKPQRFCTNLFLQWFLNFYWRLNVSCQHLMEDMKSAMLAYIWYIDNCEV